MIIRIHPDNPGDRQVTQVVDILRNGGVIIYPTDTVYGIGCDMNNHKAIEKVAKIKGIKPDKANFSFICKDLSQLSDFTTPVPNDVFRLMKRNLPGPFTFILRANSNVPKIMKSKKKTVGIRVPDNQITHDIVSLLGNPILSTSVHDDDEIVEYTTDPELINEKYGDSVDAVIDGGYGNNVASTIVDCTGDEVEILREGVVDLQ